MNPKRHTGRALRRVLTVSLSLCFINVSATVFSQEITLSLQNSSLESVLKQIREQSGYNFFLHADALKLAKPISAKIKKRSLGETLDILFKNQPLNYQIQGKSIIINQRLSDQQSPITPSSKQQDYMLNGSVSDSTGRRIPGVSIRAIVSGRTATTDDKGVFSITLKENDDRLSFSYLGMQTVVRTIDRNAFMEVTLKPKANKMEDVVVTGFFAKEKSSFTGATMSFTGEELKNLAPTSVIEALSMLTPGLAKLESNISGSDPNRVPDILVRGVTSFTNNDQSVNLPLIVRDGTIVSLKDLYDMDINEIETVTVLKDASAAALYGAKAANGVIVIERKRIAEGKLKISYNLIGSLQFPDFSGYNLLNPTQKLEYERLAGLYSTTDVSQQYGLDSLYNERFKEVQRGVNTDWLAQPSRVGSTHDHSLRLSGGASGTRYEINTRYAQVKGVMKKDYRRRYGLGFALEHYAPMGLSFTNRTNYSRIDGQNTPYGSFSTYTKMNPYDRIFDQFGAYRKVLSWDKLNPLYEATLGSYDRNSAQTLSNDFDARWTINPNFRLTTHWNITLKNGNYENYISPLSGQFKDQTDLSKRGTMAQTNDKGLSYAGNMVLSYNKALPHNSLLSTNVGANITKNDLRTSSFRGIGFYADDLSFINFASSYPTGEKPIGQQDLNTDVGAFLNANYSFKNRYFIDGVYQVSGSSKFGTNNRYGHFWSSGIGWNLHNEEFLKNDAINLLKLRGSMGYTGKVNFPSYQAMTTYQYNNELVYLNGIGAVPMTIGNPDLRWERSMNYNIGSDVSLFDRRFNLIVDIYLKKTTDLLIDKTLAPSVGVTTGKHNLGEMENRGIEIHTDFFAIRNTDFAWQLGANITRNTNKILKISDALKLQNRNNNEVTDSPSPLPQFEEGESTQALKVVPSFGIDPVTGQEIYIKRNGDLTFVYDPMDKIVVGDQQPRWFGNVFTTVRYKRFSAAAYFNFRTGGYLYNTTRASKVEGADPHDNADQRVFNDRWTQPGDIAQYKNIADLSDPKHTTRFVEKENLLELQRFNINYDFAPQFAKRIGASKVAIGLSMNDIFRLSAVKIERGTSYLYSRGIDFNLNILF